jgi:protein TonB
MVPTSRARRRPRSTQEADVSHDLFRDVTDRRPRATRATGGTLAVSIVAHTLMVAAAIVVPLLAADVLPAPVDVVRVEWEAPPPLPEVPAPAVTARKPSPPIDPSPIVTPLRPPDGIIDEIPRDPVVACPSCIVDPDALNVAFGPGDGTGAGTPQPPPPPPPPSKPVRAGGDIRMPTKIRDVAPEYPQIAQRAGVQGIVIIEAVIATDGTVRDARVLRSIALLDRAALDAVRQWRYEPTRLNGVVVPVLVTVTVQFQLQR